MRMVHGAEPLLLRVRRSVRKRRPAPAEVVADSRSSMPEGQWGDVVDLMPQVVMVVDGAGLLVQANAAAQKVLGSLFDSPTERCFLDFVDPTDRQKAAATWQAPFTRRLGWQVRLDTPAANGVFSFDCIPLALRSGGAGLAMIGRQLTGCLSPPTR
jgi:PAS domain-containing protein